MGKCVSNIAYGRDGVVVRLLASHLGELNSILGGVVPGIFAVENRARLFCWSLDFLVISRFPPPMNSVLLHTQLTSPSFGSQGLDVNSRPNLSPLDSNIASLQLLLCLLTARVSSVCPPWCGYRWQPLLCIVNASVSPVSQRWCGYQYCPFGIIEEITVALYILAAAQEYATQVYLTLLSELIQTNRQLLAQCNTGRSVFPHRAIAMRMAQRGMCPAIVYCLRETASDIMNKVGTFQLDCNSRARAPNSGAAVAQWLEHPNKGAAAGHGLEHPIVRLQGAQWVENRNSLGREYNITAAVAQWLENPIVGLQLRCVEGGREGERERERERERAVHVYLVQKLQSPTEDGDDCVDEVTSLQSSLHPLPPDSRVRPQAAISIVVEQEVRVVTADELSGAGNVNCEANCGAGNDKCGADFGVVLGCGADFGADCGADCGAGEPMKQQRYWLMKEMRTQISRGELYPSPPGKHRGGHVLAILSSAPCKPCPAAYQAVERTPLVTSLTGKEGWFHHHGRSDGRAGPLTTAKGPCRVKQEAMCGISGNEKFIHNTPLTREVLVVTGGRATRALDFGTVDRFTGLTHSDESKLRCTRGGSWLSRQTVFASGKTHALVRGVSGWWGGGAGT
ncbi:hypothetical protein PR048_023246 [Dryococelus australis]|uniref:Uncharacterized protein n=1 Tax=Dryococelus australis TaxID=614101 RepID=A0ABQ9GTJ3_9NEOP|nr:hypothetical protein PR048_023246 [Dryococelus australis]